MSNRSTAYFTTGVMVRISILAALGVVLSLLELPIFAGAPFYKLDPSGLAVMLAGFSMGFPAGAVTLLIKDLVGLLVHPSGGWVGQLADFIALFAFFAPAALVYRRHKDRTTALAGMLIGIFTMTAAALLANLFILFPAFGIPNGEKLLIPFTLPFNLLKGMGLTLITFLIYKPLSPILHGKFR